jgi:hypothetical protein
MVAQKRKREEYESDIVSLLRRGSVSILEVIAVKLPDVFAAEILPKLDAFDTLSLAQVSKSYNDAVWSVEGVRCMDAKIAAYIDINPAYSEKTTGKKPLPSMHIAAGYGNLPAVRALLESGEDDKPVTLKVLIEAGADVNAQCSDGATSLYSAAQEDNPMIVMELIKAGADVNLARHDGATPLHMAAQRGHEGCAAMLIQAGADIHRRTEMGNTPIKFAINNKHEKIAKLLRHLGARDD